MIFRCIRWGQFASVPESFWILAPFATRTRASGSLPQGTDRRCLAWVQIPVVWPWASRLNLLSLNLPICKMGEGNTVVIVVQSFSHVQLFATPWTAASQTSLSFTISMSLLKLMSIESAMLSNHFILCHPLLLLPSSLSKNQSLFQWVVSTHQVAKVLELSFLYDPTLTSIYDYWKNHSFNGYLLAKWLSLVFNMVTVSGF